MTSMNTLWLCAIITLCIWAGFTMGYYYQGYKIYSGMFNGMSATMEKLK